MHSVGGSWVVEAARSAPVEPPARSETSRQKPSRPTPWTPPAAQGRGLLIDLLV
jgi:hypothetical protein